MRVGELQRAKKRFLKALEVEPTNQIALDNLEELRSFMSYQDFNCGKLSNMTMILDLVNNSSLIYA